MQTQTTTRFNPFKVDVKQIVRKNLTHNLEKIDHNYNIYENSYQSQSIQSQSNQSKNAANSISKFIEKDYEFSEGKMDLNETLHISSDDTFLIRVKGNSMHNAGIGSGDLLIVDRKKKITNNSIIVAAINDELVVKKIRYENKTIQLISENNDFSPIIINKNDRFEIWGAVKSVIKNV